MQISYLNFVEFIELLETCGISRHFAERTWDITHPKHAHLDSSLARKMLNQFYIYIPLPSILIRTMLIVSENYQTITQNLRKGVPK